MKLHPHKLGKNPQSMKIGPMNLNDIPQYLNDYYERKHTNCATVHII